MSGWSTEFERIGHDETLVIGMAPGRVRPVLALRKGSVVTSLASFASEDAARDAIAALKVLTRAKPESVSEEEA